MRGILSIFRRKPGEAGILGDTSGAALIVIALSLSCIIGFAGLATEVASWYMTKRTMQTAADTAASAAAANLASNTSATNDQLRSDGRSVAATYGFVNGTGSTSVAVNNPPNTTTGLSACLAPFGGFSCYVEVLVSQPQTPLLSGVFLSSGPTIATRAVAKANTNVTSPACVVALSTQTGIDVNVTGTAAMNFSNCALYDNASGGTALTMNGGATINASAAYVVGGVNGSGLTTTYHPSSSQAYTGVNPLADPYASVPAPTVPSTCNQGDFNGTNGHGYKVNGNVQVTLPESTFSGSVYVFCNGIDLTSTNASLTLRPGFVYVIRGGQLNIGGNSTLTQCGSTGYSNCTVGSGTQSGGVTIFMTGCPSSSGCSNHYPDPAEAKIPSNSNVKLTAPTSGTYSGIAFFQDRVTCTDSASNCSNNLDGGANFNVTGALYFPKNAVDFSGGSATGANCTQLIAYTITLSGNSTFNSTCTSAGTATISNTNGTLVM